MPTPSKIISALTKFRHQKYIYRCRLNKKFPATRDAMEYATEESPVFTKHGVHFLFYDTIRVVTPNYDGELYDSYEVFEMDFICDRFVFFEIKNQATNWSLFNYHSSYQYFPGEPDIEFATQDFTKIKTYDHYILHRS